MNETTTRKAKLGTIAERTKGIPLNQLHTMQTAIAGLDSRLARIEAMHRITHAELGETHSMGHNSSEGMFSFIGEVKTLKLTVERLRLRIERTDSE